MHDDPDHQGDAHGHSHTTAANAGNRARLAVAFAVTATILLAEVVGAVLTGSLALLVDAAHMLTDAAGLLLALIASALMRRPSTGRLTWGYRRAEILSAAAQSLVLLGVGVYALIEGISRLFEPAEVPAAGLLAFGVIGLVGNVVAIVVLAGGRRSNLNLRAAFLEVVNDALGSVGVIISAIVIATTGWMMIDTVIALVLAALILPRAIRILLSAVRVLMESVPRGLDVQQVRAHLLEQPHVRDVHDLHASEIGTDLPVLTAHVVIDDDCFALGHAPEHLDTFRACVAEHFDVSVQHATFQLETQGQQELERRVHS